MRGEVEAALRRCGSSAYAVESLHPPSTRAMLDRFEVKPPGYEAVGEQRVAAGRYRDVIRYREHMRPLFRALGVGAGSCAA
jgi:hypothetical protein